MKCATCETILPTGKHYCAACGAWTVGEGLHDESVVPLADVARPPVERLVTGFCDGVFGGGLVRTTVSLITGPPGGGKSTACLQLTDRLVDALEAIGETGRRVLYVNTEQEGGEVRGYAERLGLRHLDRILVVRDGAAAHGLLGGGLTGDLARRPPGAAILDSLNGLCGRDMRGAVEVCRSLKEMAVKYKLPWLVISHMTKGGDLAGLEELQHLVDTITGIDVAEGPMREWQTFKNRWGPQMSEFYEMTSKGLVHDKEFSEEARGVMYEEATGRAKRERKREKEERKREKEMKESEPIRKKKV